MKKSFFVFAIVITLYTLCYPQNIIFVPKTDLVRVISGCTPPVVIFRFFPGKDADTIKVYSGFNTGVNCITNPANQVNTFNMVGFICNKKEQNDIYELYSQLEPKSSNRPKLIPLDKDYFEATEYYEVRMLYDYELKLKRKRNGIYIDSLSQNFHAQGLGIGIEDDVKSIPGECSIMSVYPNPFNPATKIKYEIAAPGFVKISVFNSLGELAEVIEAKDKYPGKYELEWNAGRFISGVYFIVLVTNDNLSTKKVILLK